MSGNRDIPGVDPYDAEPPEPVDPSPPLVFRENHQHEVVLLMPSGWERPTPLSVDGKAIQGLGLSLLVHQEGRWDPFHRPCLSWFGGDFQAMRVVVDGLQDNGPLPICTTGHDPLSAQPEALEALEVWIDGHRDYGERDGDGGGDRRSVIRPVVAVRAGWFPGDIRRFAIRPVGVGYWDVIPVTPALLPNKPVREAALRHPGRWVRHMPGSLSSSASHTTSSTA